MTSLPKRILTALVTALVLIGAGPLATAHAQGAGGGMDPEIRKLLEEGQAKLGAGEVEAAVAAFEKVLGKEPKNVYAHNYLGFIHHSQTGDFEKALSHYDAVIANSKDPRQQAYAYTQKGSIHFAERHNPNEAIKQYNLALKAHPLSSTFDVASNLYHYVHENEDALKSADEAIKYAHAEAKQQGKDAPDPAYLAKLQCGKAVVLLALGRKEEAQKIIDEAKYDKASFYNLAQYHALNDDEAKAVEFVEKALAERKDAKARNQLRDFIRRDPDFKKLRIKPTLKALVKDEPGGK